MKNKVCVRRRSAYIPDFEFAGMPADGAAEMTYVTIGRTANIPAPQLRRHRPLKGFVPFRRELLSEVSIGDGGQQAVIISGFVGIAEEMIGLVRFPFLANIIRRYEKEPDPRFGTLDNRAYLAETRDRLLRIHSTDDPMVNYNHNAGQVIALGNPNVRVITAEHKRHNPQYSAEALEMMNEWIGGITA